MKKYIYYNLYLSAVIFYLIINIIAGYGVTLFVDIKEIYSSLNTPSWAPATWVFGFVWTINNVLVLIGNIWTLKSPASKYRSHLIKLQIISWFNYAVFQWLSFGTGLPSMYFWPTFSMLVLTILSIYYAFKIDTKNETFIESVKSFKSITITFTTLFIWLCIATCLGFYIMINN